MNPLNDLKNLKDLQRYGRELAAGAGRLLAALPGRRRPAARPRPVVLRDLPQVEETPLPATRELPWKESLTDGVRATLTMLHTHLGLTTGVVLWPRPGGFAIRAAVSSRTDLQTQPIPAGAGIVGGITQGRETVTMAPVRTDQPLIPWYSGPPAPGAAIVLRLPLADGRYAVLGADRLDETPWSDSERDYLDTAARRLTADFAMEHSLARLDRELDRNRTVRQSLVELSGVLGLESVFTGTARAIASFLPVDLLAISLREEEHHRLVHVQGAVDDQAVNRQFSLEEGLVGQVLRTNHALPVAGTYHGPIPLFSNDERLESMASILVLPLRSEEGRPIAALALGGRRPGLFTPSQRETLDLIAAQVGVKIDLAQAHEKISRLATTDGLTGLANHRTFQHGFDVMLERARRNHCPLCLIMADIDHFKQINDQYGHPFGDQVLQRVAAVMAKAVRKVDLAARYGGEEFALLLEAADEKGGRQMAERIRREVERLIVRAGGKTVEVTLSLGLAFYPLDADDKERLISHADQALYKAKSAGRNRIVAWSDLRGANGG